MHFRTLHKRIKSFQIPSTLESVFKCIIFDRFSVEARPKFVEKYDGVFLKRSQISVLDTAWFLGMQLN